RHVAGNYGDGQSVGLIGRLGVHDNDDPSLRADGLAVRNVAVYGSVYANRSVGGVVGKIGKTNGGATIENCANFASVSSTDAKGVGGIVGAAWNGGVIRNCYNAGDVTGTHTNPAGGIAGSVEIPIINSYNIGTITAPPGYAMGIGTNNGGAPLPENSYYLSGSAVDGGWYTGGSANNTGARTESYMKLDEFVALLGDAFAKDTRGINNGYPVLAWQGGTAVAPAAPGATTVVDEPVALSDDPTLVVINVDTDGAEVSSITAEVTADNVKAIADNGSAIEVRSDLGNVTLPNAAMVDLAGKAEEKIDVKLTKDSADTYTLALTADDKAVAAVDGGVKLTLPAEDAGAGTVAVLVHEDGTEEVIKKSVGKDGKVTMPLDGSATVKIVDNAKSFVDVGTGAWYSDAARFASSHDLMGGTGGDKFSPDAPMTRGMLVTVLHRLENEPAATGELFTDIANGAYYAEAVTWASANAIVNGIGGGKFAPDAEITREQLATMLYRYYTWSVGDGVLDVPDGIIDTFPDADDVSEYAEDAMKWAVGAGLIQGRGGNLAPQGTATRAEVATVLQRFIEQL
ncbi:MAG: S-layer homology domain-containing protein, partial [Oscillospiraceae bacterium]|nr:S-layer homology domain-containing protein [Oscillospiraceae bacterium]